MSYLIKDEVERLEAILYDKQGLTMLPGGGMVPAGARAIRQGDVLARSTGGTRDKKFVVAKTTRLSAALGGAATAVAVDDAHAFEVGDSVVIASLGAEVITSINYEINSITFGTAPGAAAINSNVVAALNNMDEGLAIALLPSKDGNNPLLAPMAGDSFVTAALTGRFKVNKLKNFDTGGPFHTDFAGIYQVDANIGGGIYIITNVSANFALS